MWFPKWIHFSLFLKVFFQNWLFQKSEFLRLSKLRQLIFSVWIMYTYTYIYVSFNILILCKFNICSLQFWIMKQIAVQFQVETLCNTDLLNIYNKHITFYYTHCAESILNKVVKPFNKTFIRLKRLLKCLFTLRTGYTVQAIFWKTFWATTLEPLKILKQMIPHMKALL